MKRIIILLLAILVTHLCEAACPTVTPSFTFTTSSVGAALLNATFSNTTSYTPTATQMVSYTIDYGDGSSEVIYGSTSHNYSAAGTYSAVLMMVITDSVSTVCTYTSPIQTVTVSYASCGTVINATVISATASAENVGFTYTTPSLKPMSTYDWDFGDGGTSAVMSPNHTYVANGTYNVTLHVIATDASCDYHTNATVHVSSIFDCSTDMITGGSSGVTVIPAASDKTIYYNVAFTAPTPAQSNIFAWDFGDGLGIMSTSQSGYYTYTDHSSHNVTVTVSWTDTLGTAAHCPSTATAPTGILPTIAPPNRISGHISFPCGTLPVLDSTVNTIEVFLITLTGTTLGEAAHGYAHYAAGGSYYYEFNGIANGYYRIKANLTGQTTTWGYQPTYDDGGAGALTYSGASILSHTGLSDDNNDIPMHCGTITPGAAGVVYGDVFTDGANKLTSANPALAGILMLVKNATTGQLMQGVYTDTAGHYAFSNLPVGETYYILPEDLNYSSIPFTGISLTSSSPSMTVADFVLNTVSMTILPSAPAGVTNVNEAAYNVSVFPNPNSGILNIRWQQMTAGEGMVTIADITGRKVYTSTMNFTKGAGSQQLDLAGLENGLYVITIKSASGTYNDKLEIVH